MVGRETINNSTGNSNSEGFEYDNFDRLKKVTTTSLSATVVKQNIQYEDNGNIASKDDCGLYIYGNANQPYTLTQLQNQQNNISLNTLNFVYNDFQKVNQISEATTNKQFDFIYGNNENRIQMDSKIGGQLQYSRFYQDLFDREETGQNIREWSYVVAPTGLTGVFYTTGSTTSYYDITTDQNGSPILLTGSNSQIVEEQSFDAWGRRRNPVDWSYNNLPNTQILIRGYGFHEHLDELGLINMNGRLYEPILGRFVQVDPLVKEPDNAQNYNRYSYVCNNPVNYSDPSGYSRVGNSGIGIESQAEARTNPFAGPPVIIVDGNIESGGSNMAFWLGRGGGGSDGVTKEYAGNLSSLGIISGMGHDANGVLYGIGETININTGLRKGTVVRKAETGRYGEYVQLKHKVGDKFENQVTGKVYNCDPDAAAVIQWTEFETDQAIGGNGFNINNAVATLNENAGTSSQSACGRYIRYALESGFGLQKDAFRGITPVPARQFGSFLQGRGFTPISTSNYLPGDIGVIQPYQGGNPNGHIQMYNGIQWISDFRQRDIWPGLGYRTNQPALQIYRWGPTP